MRGPVKRGRRAIFPWEVHPIWRGIGCVMVILIPALAYGISYSVFDQFWPAELGSKTSPVFIRYIGTYDSFRVVVVLGTILLTPILLTLLSVVASLLFSVLGGDKTERMGRFLPKDKR